MSGGPSEGLSEVPLFGGDVTEGVVRVGETVRRPPSAQSAAVQAYLCYLEQRGFAESPRVLGFDDRGREILTYIDGEMAGRPLHPWAVDEDLLRAVARLQRKLHDASLGFTLPAGVDWLGPVHLDGVPPPYDLADVIGHNDMTPENLIFIDRMPVGIVDFDLAGPTTRLLDIVTTLLHWAPLRDPVDRDPVFRDVDAGRRMRSFVDAYELDALERSKLLEVADRRFARSWPIMRYRAEHDGGGWARMWDAGIGDVILRGRQWLHDHHASLESALLD